jgi:cytochrome o ubiquinol oxidase subunit 3
MSSLTVHHQSDPEAKTSWPDPHQDRFSKTYLGFWIYLMTDCLLFVSFFVTYAVLESRTFGGPSGKDIFSLSTAFSETMVLLASSVTCGFAMLSAAQKNSSKTIKWLLTTIILGIVFLGIEIHEFTSLVNEGKSWHVSAFLSSFFALVGLHGCHIFSGVLWASVMICQIKYMGINPDSFRRLSLFSMFWHFLDLIWIFIFTFVYLMGVI